VRGADDQTGVLFSYLSPGALVSPDDRPPPVPALVNVSAECLLTGNIAVAFLLVVMGKPAVNGLLSYEHFSITVC